MGIAIGVVLLPDLSRRLGAQDTAGGRDAFNRAAEIGLALTLPAAVALVVIPTPLISVLFQRGAFDAADTAATAAALAIYGLGLPAFVLQKVFQPLFFAREDTRTPFYYALCALVINAALAIGLAPFLGYLAAAIGTSVAAWAMVLQLWLGSRRFGAAAALDDRFIHRIGRIAVACTIMGLCLYIAALWLEPAFTIATWRYLVLALVVAVGLGSYFTAAHVLDGLPLRDIRRSLRR